MKPDLVLVKLILKFKPCMQLTMQILKASSYTRDLNHFTVDKEWTWGKTCSFIDILIAKVTRYFLTQFCAFEKGGYRSCVCHIHSYLMENTDSDFILGPSSPCSSCNAEDNSKPSSRYDQTNLCQQAQPVLLAFGDDYVILIQVRVLEMFSQGFKEKRFLSFPTELLRIMFSPAHCKQEAWELLIGVGNHLVTPKESSLRLKQH